MSVVRAGFLLFFFSSFPLFLFSSFLLFLFSSFSLPYGLNKNQQKRITPGFLLWILHTTDFARLFNQKLTNEKYRFIRGFGRMRIRINDPM
jgi:hypothetical protein